MKKQHLLAAIFGLLAFSANAQSGVHTWKMGPLTWNDFHHNTAIYDKTSYLEYFLTIDSREVKVDNIKYRIPALKAFTTHEYSWADTNFRTPQLLAYNQCMFDLVELHRRKIERDIINTNLWEEEQAMTKGRNRLDEDLLRVEADTRYGNNLEALEKWQARVKTELDSVKEFTPTRFVDGKYAFGASIGLGSKILVGDISKHFGTSFGLDFNFDLCYRRSYFTWGTYIGWARAKQNIWESEYVAEFDTNFHPASNHYVNPLGEDVYPVIFKGELPTVFNMFLAYGYTVFNNNLHKITPFVGAGIESYSIEEDEVSYGPTIGAWLFGVDYNYQYRNSIDQGSFSFNPLYNATHDVACLNVKLFGAYDNFKNIVGAPKGLSINLQVNIGFYTGNAHYE